MVTITEDYVSFETAKLLKDKGFQQLQDDCGYFTTEMVYGINVDDNGEHHFAHQYPAIYDKDNYIAAPTLQMAMKWLREIYHIHTEICLYKTSENDIEPKKSRKVPYYTFGVWDSVTGDNADKRLTNDFIGNNYEEACEAAIKYCLEYLI